MSGLISNLLDRANYFLEDIFAFISAPKCPGCGMHLEDPRMALCPPCSTKLFFPGDGPVCMICRSPVGVSCDCSEILHSPVPGLFYWAPYTDVIRALIHQFKFEQQARLGKYLTEKALEKLGGRLLVAEFDSIIPIPMLKRDKKKRTFNQTEMIADNMSRYLDRPVQFDNLKKTKPTRLQADLGRKERWQNVLNAFDVEYPEVINGKTILLVDDIVTTGATCLEASKVLYSARAKKVTVFSIASSH